MAKTLDEQIAVLEAAGYVTVQLGRVKQPPGGRRTFADRVEGFDISLLTVARPGGPEPSYAHKLLDDEERWVHMQKPIGEEKDNG